MDANDISNTAQGITQATQDFTSQLQGPPCCKDCGEKITPGHRFYTIYQFTVQGAGPHEPTELYALCGPCNSKRAETLKNATLIIYPGPQAPGSP